MRLLHPPATPSFPKVFCGVKGTKKQYQIRDIFITNTYHKLGSVVLAQFLLIKDVNSGQPIDFHSNLNKLIK